MMVNGSRRPWWYMVFGASLALFTILLLFGVPNTAVSNIRTSALDRMCENREDTQSSRPVNSNADYTPESTRYQNKANYTTEVKPPTKVIGLIFAGRRRYLEILNCYLLRNLAKNGGWLDEIKWVIKTDIQEDIDFINKLVAETPEYTNSVGHRYQDAYLNLEDAIYVKIDDDVVFMEDNAIPAIVSRIYNNPQYSLISANVMNQPALAFVHYHLGAIHPYLPEVSKPANFDENAPPANWRPSRSPHWEGDVNRDVKNDYKQVYKNHRWLRMQHESDIVNTPVGRLGHEGAEYNAFNAALMSWSMAAQQHYSFLENLEKDELWRYKFETWHYFYERLSINFIAFHSSLVMENPIPDDTDDERFLTVDLPKKLQRPAVLDGTGMIVHFGFGPQTEKLGETDLLSRYKGFAQENVCGRPWGQAWVLGG